MINPSWRWILGGVSFLLLTGCTVSATYNNLDRLARWQIADYVDFDDRQDAYFRAELDRVLYWHRVSELPVYAERLDQLAREINQEFTEPTLEAMIKDVRTWAERIEAEAMSMTIELMLSLTDAQVAELPARLEKANAEFAEDELDVDLSEVRENWADSMVDGAKYFMGSLTREQRDYVQAQSLRYQPEQVMWVEYRRRWQAAFLEALSGRREATAFATRYRQLVKERESFWSPEFTSVSKSNDALRRDVTLKLLRTANDQQRERMTERLSGFSEDFRELTAAAEIPGPSGGGCLIRGPSSGQSSQIRSDSRGSSSNQASR